MCSVDETLNASSLKVANYKNDIRLLTEEHAEVLRAKSVLEMERSTLRSELAETSSLLEDSRRQISSVEETQKASALKVAEFSKDLKLLTEEYAEVSRAKSALEMERNIISRRGHCSKTSGGWCAMSMRR